MIIFIALHLIRNNKISVSWSRCFSSRTGLFSITNSSQFGSAYNYFISVPALSSWKSGTTQFLIWQWVHCCVFFNRRSLGFFVWQVFVLCWFYFVYRNFFSRDFFRSNELWNFPLMASYILLGSHGHLNNLNIFNQYHEYQEFTLGNLCIFNVTVL